MASWIFYLDFDGAPATMDTVFWLAFIQNPIVQAAKYSFFNPPGEMVYIPSVLKRNLSYIWGK